MTVTRWLAWGHALTTHCGQRTAASCWSGHAQAPSCLPLLMRRTCMADPLQAVASPLASEVKFEIGGMASEDPSRTSTFFLSGPTRPSMTYFGQGRISGSDFRPLSLPEVSTSSTSPLEIFLQPTYTHSSSSCCAEFGAFFIRGTCSSKPEFTALTISRSCCN